MRVLREHKDSVMAVLEAFVYDPLLNWRLMDSKWFVLRFRCDWVLLVVQINEIAFRLYLSSTSLEVKCIPWQRVIVDLDFIYNVWKETVELGACQTLTRYEAKDSINGS